eukprot:1161729-Pelagomonas_calceolata.AAC.10
MCKGGRIRARPLLLVAHSSVQGRLDVAVCKGGRMMQCAKEAGSEQAGCCTWHHGASISDCSGCSLVIAKCWRMVADAPATRETCVTAGGER